MSKLIRFFSRRLAVRKEIESWPDKQREFVMFVYGLLKSIEGTDFLAYLSGMIPLALIDRVFGSGFVLAPAVLPEKYMMFWSFGCSLLIYFVTVALVNKLVIKRLQRMWIGELKRKLDADKELVATYKKMEQLDSYPCWRIYIATLRLNKFL